jgi:hypothetical protein
MDSESDTSLLPTANGSTPAARGKWTREEIQACEKIINEQISAEDNDLTPELWGDELWHHCSQQLVALGIHRSQASVERQFRSRLKRRARSPPPIVNEASKVSIKRDRRASPY